MEESESNFCQNVYFQNFALNGRFGNSQNSEFFPRELIKVMNDLELETDNHQQTLEALGIIGLFIFAIFYFKFNQRNTMIQKFLAVSWMIIGYKFYLEKGIFKLLNCSKTNLLIGIINLIVGCILYSNFIELFKLKDWKDKKSLMNNFKQIFNFIFLNFSFEIYDVDKITLNNPNTNTNQANSFTFKLILNYTFLILNTFPLLTNFFIKKRLFNFNFSLYPSPLALATITIFLNYFRNSNYVSSKVFILLDILCYSLLIVNLVNDFVFLKIYSFENFFFILLNVLNLIFIYYFDIYNLNSGNSVESLKSKKIKF
jgi:hypothetical protein